MKERRCSEDHVYTSLAQRAHTPTSLAWIVIDSARSFSHFPGRCPPPTPSFPIPFHCAVYLQRHGTCRVSRSCIDICFFFQQFKVYLHSGLRERRKMVGEKERNQQDSPALSTTHQFSHALVYFVWTCALCITTVKKL